MACFIVPATEAVVTTVAAKHLEKKESAFTYKLKWLSKLLCGGSGLLVFEHIWHGELIPFFPFLTAAADGGDISSVIKEIATTGMSMALLMTVIWLAAVGVTDAISKKAQAEEADRQ